MGMWTNPKEIAPLHNTRLLVVAMIDARNKRRYQSMQRDSVHRL